MLFPFHLVFIPCPGIASNLSASGTLIFNEAAFFIIASASGCSDPFSAIAAVFISSTSFSDTILVTSGSPFVSVPVLSNTTFCSLYALSRYSPPRINMPNSAPLPTPTINAVGVAIPSAQGQDIIRTATNDNIAIVRFPAINHHPANESKATTTTAGTK